jgi:hypothetical protein
MITLLQGLLRQSIPAIRAIDRLRRLHRHIQVPTFNRKLKARIGVLHKVQCNLKKEDYAGG